MQCFFIEGFEIVCLQDVHTDVIVLIFLSLSLFRIYKEIHFLVIAIDPLKKQQQQQHLGLILILRKSINFDNVCRQ